MTPVEWLIIAVVVVAVIALVLALVDNELLVELAGGLFDWGNVCVAGSV